MLLRWLGAGVAAAFNRRREYPFRPAWEAMLRASVRQWAWLADEERETVRGFVANWLARKRFEGCRGMVVTDEVAVSIAGQAGIAAIGLDGECFDRIRSVLIYPGDYAAPKSVPLAGGSELVFQEHRLGEVWSGGSIVFSWPRVVDGGRMRDGPRSVVVHEVAHAFDLLDGSIDGIPPLAVGVDPRRWREVFGGSYASFLARFSRSRGGRREATEPSEDTPSLRRATPLDDYAAESPAEYFAVASEAFFQEPTRLARSDLPLYELLREAWRQDPIRRVG
jgi:Mlc titration factor MtfA (ptsG expression regulator)